jgi:repressor LexA
MSRKKLTAKQHSFLQYIVESLHENGVWPTYRELVDHFDFRSPNSVTQNLQALHKKGYLRRDDSGYHLVLPEQKAPGIPVRGITAARSAGSRRSCSS